MTPRKRAEIQEEAVEKVKEELKPEIPEQAEPEPEVVEQESKVAVHPKTAVITAPNTDYCGKIGGVGFAAGKAELELKEENTRMLHWFQDNGYEVTYI